MFFMNSKVIEEDMQDIYNREIEWKELKNKTIIITGATGMLASYIVYFLLFLNEYHKMEIKIMLLARDGKKVQQRFSYYVKTGFHKIYTFNINEPWDIRDRVDYIIHTASLASPQYYSTMPVEVAEPNVIGTYHLLNFARKKRVKKVLFFSSGDVYGKLSDNIGDIKEDMMGITDPLDEHSCYGESKRMGETWCAAFTKEYNVPTVIARIGHTYGPTMSLETDSRVFASFMKCVYEGKDINMFSDGSAKRPFCYIADAVAAFFLLLFRGDSGVAYNVCNTRDFISILELANVMIGLRPELNLHVVRKIRNENDQYMNNIINFANRPIENKLKNLGWKCNFDVQKGFSRVLQYLFELDKQDNTFID